jgi:signal transduction histidine kinase/ActR/RegA family two-component response regulator
MIANLRDTTQTNKEQDWLKTNLAKFSGMMQGQRSLESLAELIMSELTPVASAQLGTFFVSEISTDRPPLRLLSSYGYTRRKSVSNYFSLGEGLVGQAALEKKAILVTKVPEGYVAISSSLGEGQPRNIIVLPILFEGRVRGVIELGSFEEFSPIHLTFLEQLALSIGVVMNMISASRRTEELLEELKRSNAQLEQRSNELEEKASLLEVRNREIAEAGANLEEKAKQLALVSKYKSEFLANMSHELRTPLNSIMILASLLADNQDGNLTLEQVEYARTIHSSGKDLLALINQILDLSKIEAGKMEIQRRRLPLGEVKSYIEQHFRPIARQKNLRFEISISPDAPATVTTDPQRSQQILKNLLSNAFKFTESGSVEVRMTLEPDTHRFQSQTLRRGGPALAFSITDTGIGVPNDKQQIIFEAFQQADASTSRVYGGTGLGLTISRELARLLGGEIHLRSSPGLGSTFTLYLPTQPDDLLAGPGGGYELDHADTVAPGIPALLDREARATVVPESLAPVPAVGPERLDLHADPAPESSEPGEVRRVAALEPERAEGRPSSPSDAPRPARSGELSGRKILVVDDDVRNLFAVTSLLERHGAIVMAAGSAREAFEVLERAPDADLVLMDMMMPEVDGYAATRSLRKHMRFRHLPIIALTAKAMPGDREKVLEAGCDDFIPKPVERDRLISVLVRWLRQGAET